MSHTPGPWGVREIRRVKCNYAEIRTVNGGGIGHRIALVDIGDGDMNAANARLIAAAPDMLEALQEFLAAVDGVTCGETADEEQRVWKAWHTAKNVVRIAEGK